MYITQLPHLRQSGSLNQEENKDMNDEQDHEIDTNVDIEHGEENKSLDTSSW